MPVPRMRAALAGRASLRFAARLSVAILLSALLLAGCEDDTKTKSPKGYYVYAAGSIENRFAGWVMDADSGELFEMDGSPFNGFGAVKQLAVSPDLGNLYTMFSVFGLRVAVKTIESDGALTSVAGAVYTIDPSAFNGSMAIHPDGSHLWAWDATTNSVSRTERDPATGELSLLGTTTTPGIIGGMAMTPDGDHLYVSQTAGQVLGYSINANTGALPATSGSPYSVGVSPTELAIDPTGTFLAVHDPGSNLVITYKIKSNGDLQLAGNATYSGTLAAMTFDGLGQYLYFVDSNSRLRGYNVATDGSLSKISGSPFDIGTQPASLAFSPDGNYLLTVDQTESLIRVFEIASGVGVPDEVPSSPRDAPSQPTAVTLADPTAQ